MFEGLFELQTAKDLLPKLQHDYDRLKKSPVDSYAAPTAFDVDELRVELGEEAAREYGLPAIEVLELADKVLHFWQERVE